MRFDYWCCTGVVILFTADLVSSWGSSDSSEESESSEEIIDRVRKIDSSEEIVAVKKDNRGYVEVFEHNDFKGKKLTITRGSQGCINFHRSNISHFNDYITSINLNGNCLDIYIGVGCIGQHLVLNSTSKCLKNLVQCKCNDKISSLKFCETSLPEAYLQPKGSQGVLCKGACENHEKNYFSCKLPNGSTDYCLPRPGMDSYGNTCNQSCSITEQYNLMPVFYEHEGYSGKYLEINNTENRNQCYNFRYKKDAFMYFDNQASSVDIKENCIYLYEHIGCTGKRLELSPQLNVGCKKNLKSCSWNDVTTSFRFCDSNFPPKYENPIGSRGTPCNTSCETQGMPYFWCGIQNGDWDYCSPRPGMDFLGNDCGGHCIYNATKFPQLAVMYEQKWRHGKVSSISNDDEKPCFNLRYQNDSSSPIAKKISSIDLRGSCVHLYENINCTGEKVKLTSEDNATCLYELGLKGCRGTVTVASVEFCNENFQPSGEQFVMETSNTTVVLTDSCRKHNDCVSCVMDRCIFPGFKSFPCRHSWDIVGDYPYNPPIMTTKDCINIHNRYSIIKKHLNASIGSLSIQEKDSPGVNAWVVIAALAGICVISGISYTIITKYCSRRMDSSRVLYTRSLI